MTGLVVDAVGPSEASWQRATAGLPTWTVPADAHVVVVAPHPDDETLGVGGMLQLVADRGGRIDLVSVTDGEGSHPGVPGLAERRRGELRVALGHLGLDAVTHVHHLAVPDGTVARHERQVADAILRLAARGSLLLAPYQHDGHTDHDAAGRAAASAADAADLSMLAYPVWAWQWHDPATSALLRGARRVPLPPEVLERKRRAVEAHRSQVADELGAPIVPPHVLARLLRDHEILVDPCA